MKKKRIIIIIIIFILFIVFSKTKKNMNIASIYNYINNISLNTNIILANTSNTKENNALNNADSTKYNGNVNTSNQNISTSGQNSVETSSASQEKIELHDLDGKNKKFSFVYKGETYNATYSKDNWHIANSYKITNMADITMICQALIDIHKIHGSDMVSYRTAEDLANEWFEHNLAYELLPDDNSWKKNAKDVDLNPSDQGKNLKEMYESRTGKKVDIKSMIKKYVKKEILQNK